MAVGDKIYVATKSQLDNLAGTGRTTQTVKGTADALAAHQANYVKHPGYAVSTNNLNDYAVTLIPAPTAYVDGMGIAVTINADSTGEATLNVNGLGAKPILKSNGNAVSNLKTNGVYTVRYNPNANAGAGAFILQGEGGEYGTATSNDVRISKTFGTENGIVQGSLDLSNVAPENIKKGITIDGVTGTFVKKEASGSTTSSGANKTVSVRGLDFTPKVIHVYCYYSYYYARYYIEEGSSNDKHSKLLISTNSVGEVQTFQTKNAFVISPDGFDCDMGIGTTSTTFYWYASE